MARNALRLSFTVDGGVIFLLVGLISNFPRRTSSRTSSISVIAPPFAVPPSREKEPLFTNNPFDAPSVCLRESVAYDMVWSVCRLRWEPNDSQNDVVIRSSKLGDMFLAEGPHHTCVPQGLNRPKLLSYRAFRLGGRSSCGKALGPTVPFVVASMMSPTRR